ncbi:hypothetical protein CRG98_031097 [Punica granatum]|uniref:Uncharacterized protein n=1 Tax=Punica granatum TaxID=22663 RepID=A0A2I0IX22_PUNGR|nr:hypothetical protein CRG98_031097 [Punica granatum]
MAPEDEEVALSVPIGGEVTVVRLRQSQLVSSWNRDHSPTQQRTESVITPKAIR